MSTVQVSSPGNTRRVVRWDLGTLEGTGGQELEENGGFWRYRHL